MTRPKHNGRNLRIFGRIGQKINRGGISNWKCRRDLFFDIYVFDIYVIRHLRNSTSTYSTFMTYDIHVSTFTYLTFTFSTSITHAKQVFDNIEVETMELR